VNELQVSVVAATHDRADRLDALLASLWQQTLDPDSFEVVIVDDGSSDATPAVLGHWLRRRDGPALRVLRRERATGPASARNEGWRAARASVVAFTDDDCRAAPEWLEAGLGALVIAAGERPDQEAIVQGATEPDPLEADRLGPFSRSLSVTRLDGWFATANIFYPRSLLERLGGFDGETFTGAGGEDTDLAWRALAHGVPAAFCPEARAWHAVHDVGPVGRLRNAARWAETMAVFARHPGLRRRNLVRGIFWKDSHYLLVRTLVALVLPRRLRAAAVSYLAWRYGVQLWQRAHQPGDGSGGGPAAIPFFVLHDAVEVATAARGAVRYRTVVL
jgi:glycosyltransferase involved in cell wall biosynthesis